MKKFKLFFMDVDGTLTDGKIYMGPNGEVFKAFNVKDGLGIHDLLIKNDIVPIIITGRQSKIVEKRCKEIGIKEIYQGADDKMSIIQAVCKKYKCSLQDVAYVGDDLNDLPCIELVNQGGGITACPRDAVDKLMAVVSYVSSKNGGDGAVRDVIDYITT